MQAKILKCGYSAQGAKNLLLNTDPNLELTNVDEIFYPYVRFRYLVNVGHGTRIKSINKLSDCIIDRVMATKYESRGEPVYDDAEIMDAKALDIEVPMDKCYEIGHNFTLKQYVEKGKLMMTPRIEVLEEDHFYKKFYIITCLDSEQQEYYIMVDAVDGGITVLDHEKYH